MNIEDFRNYCIQKVGASESFPFPRNLPNALVFKVAGKMFASTDVMIFASITLKCDTYKVAELRETYLAVTVPGYMNKNHWNRIIMDNSIPDRLLYQWIDDSYNLVISGKSRKKK